MHQNNAQITRSLDNHYVVVTSSRFVASNPKKDGACHLWCQRIPVLAGGASSCGCARSTCPAFGTKTSKRPGFCLQSTFADSHFSSLAGARSSTCSFLGISPRSLRSLVEMREDFPVFYPKGSRKQVKTILGNGSRVRVALSLPGIDKVLDSNQVPRHFACDGVWQLAADPRFWSPIRFGSGQPMSTESSDTCLKCRHEF